MNHFVRMQVGVYVCTYVKHFFLLTRLAFTLSYVKYEIIHLIFVSIPRLWTIHLVNTKIGCV